jgi:hypothetical protein
MATSKYDLRIAAARKYEGNYKRIAEAWRELEPGSSITTETVRGWLRRNAPDLSVRS